MIPPHLWKACDFVLQFNFTIAHIPGKTNTSANFSSRLESDPNEKTFLNIRENIPKQPIEVNIESTGIAREDQVFFNTDDVSLPSEEQQWQQKQN